MKRVSVVGNSGAGKTTVGRRLAARLGAPFVELDALYHLEGWKPRPHRELRAMLKPLVEEPEWVIDGNYSDLVQDQIWPAADTVVWLDLPRRTVMPAIAKRTIVRIATGRELWNGNTERFPSLVNRDPRENILLWSWTRHHLIRDRYAKSTLDPSWEHLEFIRLTSRAQVRRFLAATE